MRYFIGISAATIRRELSPPLKAAVMTTFGAGNGPNNYVEVCFMKKDEPQKNARRKKRKFACFHSNILAQLLDAIKEACDRGVVIVNVTQCWKGTVIANYETGLALFEAGVVSGNVYFFLCLFFSLI